MLCDLVKNCVSASPIKACMRMTQGAFQRWEFILTDARGEAVDLTGQQVEFTIKDGPGGNVKYTHTNTPGDHADPTNGKTIFDIDHTAFSESTTDVLQWVFTVERIKATSEVLLHLTGQFILDPVI